MKSKIISKESINSTRSWINIIKVIFLTLLLSLPTASQAAKVTDFIPKDSVAYFQINDLDEVYNQIEMSETWALIGGEENKEMQNGLMLIQNIISADIYTVIETVGYQVGFAIWMNEAGNQQGGFVVHSGGNLTELKRFTKIAIGLLGLSEGTLKLDAGEYRNVKYDTLQIPEFLLTYGFVGDFLVIGIRENSFEKLIDTYRKKSQSIRRNKSYVETTKAMDSGQVNMYIDVGNFLPYLDDVDEDSRTHIEAITNVSAVLNLLERGPILQFQAKIDPGASESLIGRFLKEGEDFSTLKSLSGDEDLFICVAQGILKTAWEFITEEIEYSDDNAFAFITHAEEILNLDFDDDIVAGLTGEIALSVNDLSLFVPNSLVDVDLQLLDARNVHTHGGIIYNAANSEKWRKIKNSLSNINNSSVSRMDYKDTNILIFATNIHYAEKDGLSLISVSDDQMFSLIDSIENKEKLSYMKLVPKEPLAIAKLNMLKILKMVSKGKTTINEGEMTNEISPLLAWINVKGDSAMLEVVVSEKEAPLDTILKLVPFILPNIK